MCWFTLCSHCGLVTTCGLVTLSGTGGEDRALVGGGGSGLREHSCKMGEDLVGKVRVKVTEFPSLGTGNSSTAHNKTLAASLISPFAHALYPVNQQILLAVPSKHTPVLTTLTFKTYTSTDHFHHPNPNHPGPGYDHLLSGLSW